MLVFFDKKEKVYLMFIHTGILLVSHFETFMMTQSALKNYDSVRYKHKQIIWVVTHNYRYSINEHTMNANFQYICDTLIPFLETINIRNVKK